MESNNMAMREAMAKIAKCMDEILVRTELDSIIHRKALEAQNLADGVLMEPPRNSDVGTAEEQAKRFFAFCDSNKCPSCPCTKTDCALIWAQMPYEEGGGK